jgi:hypothetical protein
MLVIYYRILASRFIHATTKYFRTVKLFSLISKFMNARNFKICIKYLLEYNVDQSVESEPEFRRNMSASYSGSKDGQSVKKAERIFPK